MSTLLKLQNIFLSLEGTHILKNISLEVERKTFVTLIGPNGSGKTTLLRVCLGLLTPTKGTLTKVPDLKIGYMPQRLHLDKTLPLTVETFLRLASPRQKTQETLERVGAKSLLKSQVQSLSGGELQRVLLARALLRKPDFLVLDEPLQGVDVGGQAELYQLIDNYRKEMNCAVLLVSHDLYFVHKSSDHVICLNQHICCSGHPEDVQKNPAYRTLFGKPLPDNIAPYTHHHDHSHDHAPDQNLLTTQSKNIKEKDLT